MVKATAGGVAISERTIETQSETRKDKDKDKGGRPKPEQPQSIQDE